MKFKDLMKINPQLPSLVCSITQDGGDGANGGGGDGAPAFDPEAFKEEIKNFTVKAVNGAVSTHLTRALDSKLEANNKSLMENFQKLMSERAPEPKGEQGNPASGNPDIDAAIKNATAPLMKQLEEQRAHNERIQAEAKRAQEERMRTEEESALQSALTSAGVPGPLAAAAVNILRPKLERDGDQLRFISKETGPTGPYDERVEIAEGVSRFLKTEDGKHFLPARSASGSGSHGGNAPAVGGSQENDHDFVGSLLGSMLG